MKTLLRTLSFLGFVAAAAAYPTSGYFTMPVTWDNGTRTLIVTGTIGPLGAAQNGVVTYRATWSVQSYTIQGDPTEYAPGMNVKIQPDGIGPVASSGNFNAGSYDFNLTEGQDYDWKLYEHYQANPNNERASLMLTAGSAQQKKVTVSLFNSRDVPVKYRAQQGETVLGEVTLQPNTGIIQQFYTYSDDPVQIYEQVDDLYFDGTSWSLVEGAVTTKQVKDGLTPVPSNQTQQPTTVAQSTEIPKQVSPTPPPPTAPVWKPVAANTNPAAQSDLLTNPVFREGIDKIVSELKGEAVTPSTFTQENAVTTSMAKTAVDSILPRLPAMPTITAPQAVGIYSWNMKVPGMAGTYAVVIDLTPWETPIGIFKGIVTAVMALMFFFMTLRAIKEAFA